MDTKIIDLLCYNLKKQNMAYFLPNSILYTRPTFQHGYKKSTPNAEFQIHFSTGISGKKKREGGKKQFVHRRPGAGNACMKLRRIRIACTKLRRIKQENHYTNCGNN